MIDPLASVALKLGSHVLPGEELVMLIDSPDGWRAIAAVGSAPSPYPAGSDHRVVGMVAVAALAVGGMAEFIETYRTTQHDSGCIRRAPSLAVVHLPI